MRIILVVAAILVEPCRCLSALAPAAGRAFTRARASAPIAKYDSEWMRSGERLPFSGRSIEVLLRFGPVVYGQRCFNAEEYDMSVRKLQGRFKGISREIAEQEINELLFDLTKYMATPGRANRRPREQDLLPPVSAAEKGLVAGWVVILAFATSYIGNAAMNLK